mgnify:FL=1
MHPIVQHALHLKRAAIFFCAGQHPQVGLRAGDKPCIQQLPLLAFKGQLGYLLLYLGIAEAVYQVGLGVEIHHDTAQIKDDIFIHRCFLNSVWMFLPERFCPQYSTNCPPCIKHCAAA